MKVFRILILFTLLSILFSGCSKLTTAIPNNKMLHSKQVLEHYNAVGDPQLQYYEVWTYQDRSLTNEVNVADGSLLTTAIDTKNKHIKFDPVSKKAENLKKSISFSLNYLELKKGFANETKVENQMYASRDCTVHLLSNNNEDDWIKLYIDNETGFILFCDAPLFRLRTAILEVLPYDEKLFQVPTDLIYE